MNLVAATPTVVPTNASSTEDRGPRIWVVFVLLLLVAATVRIPAFSNRVFNSDEAYLATQAESLLHGGKLYVDTVDRKPPIVPYLYAAVFEITGSDDLGAVRVLATFALAATALLVALEARRRFEWRFASPVAGLLYLLTATAFRPLDAQAANFEVFVLPMTVGAMLLAIRRRTLVAGLSLALATLTLQSAAIFVIPLGFLAWRARRWRGIVTLAVAYVAPIVFAAIVFGWRAFLRWVFTSNGSYVDAQGAIGYVARLGVSQTAWFLLGSAAVVVLVPFAWRQRRRDVELWLWLATAMVVVVAGLRFFGHYYMQLLPPLTLLGVRGLVSRPLAGRRWVVVAVAASAIGVSGAFFVGAFTSQENRDTRVALAVGEYIEAHTKPDERVLVWGQAPEAYWAADRRPAVRFATTGFVTGSSGGRPPAHVGERFAVPGARADFLSDLRVHPPVLIADMSTANQRHASLAPPASFPEFARYLGRGGWKRVATVDGVAILRQSER